MYNNYNNNYNNKKYNYNSHASDGGVGYYKAKDNVLLSTEFQTQIKKYTSVQSNSVYRIVKCAMIMNGISQKERVNRSANVVTRKGDIVYYLNQPILKVEISYPYPATIQTRLVVFNKDTGEEFPPEEIAKFFKQAQIGYGDEPEPEPKKPEFSNEDLFRMLKDYGKFDSQNSDNKMCFYGANIDYLIKKCNLPYTVEEMYEFYLKLQKAGINRVFGKGCDLWCIQDNYIEMRIYL